MSKRYDLIGKQFGHLTVASFAGYAGGAGRWVCLCTCGATRTVKTGELNIGNVVACAACGFKLRCQNTANSKTLPGGLGAFRRVLHTYRKNAKSRGLTFSLSESEICNLLLAPCAYCGDVPRQVSRSGRAETRRAKRVAVPAATFIYNGIDRMDNARGYEPDNVCTCCKTCNRAKHAQPLEDFLAWAQRVAAHQNKQACAA